MKSVSLLLLTALVSFAPCLHADKLLMEGLGDEPPNSAEGLPRPARGMSMEGVVERFGEPTEKLPAVGDPPITRWVYDGYTVYFEDRHTITSVVHR